MLKITIKDDDANLRITVEGDLTDQLAKVLDANWQNAEALRKTKKVVVDLCGVTAIDAAGKEVLGRMIKDGADFSVSGPKTAYIIDTLRTECKRNRASREAEKASFICGFVLLILISLFAAEKVHAEHRALPANVESPYSQTSVSWRLR
jgi:ABC-type transporter Mla MlaB component